MKNNIISAFRSVLHDRYLVVLSSILLVASLIVIIIVSISIEPSELQVVVHYTSYGTTNFYRDKWYYLISFAVFVVLFVIVHTILMYKILQTKGRSLAVSFIWLGFVVLGISAILFYQVLKIASLS